MSDTAVAEKQDVVVSGDVKKVHQSALALSSEDKGQLFVELLKSMTGLELVEASKMIEDQLDVTASGGGMMMAAPVAADAAAAEPEQTEFDVHLTSYGDVVQTCPHTWLSPSRIQMHSSISLGWPDLRSPSVIRP